MKQIKYPLGVTTPEQKITHCQAVRQKAQRRLAAKRAELIALQAATDAIENAVTCELAVLQQPTAEAVDAIDLETAVEDVPEPIEGED
jgi:hypothetical protein